MARERFKIEGLRELEQALAELPKATGKNVLKRTLLKAGAPIASMAASLAPHLKGKLRQSFGTGTKLSRRQRSQHKQESSVEVFAGAGPLVQAITQEFGTRNHPPQPFMRPAWDANKRPALESIKDDLRDEIEKARARLARKAAREIAKMRRG